MQITILGAGWLGRQLAHFLLLQGAAVTLTCVQEDSAESLRREFPACRIIQTTSLDSFQSALAQAEAVIVCVAPSSRETLDRLQAYRKCYLGVAESLRKACETSSSPRIWVVISSTSVYAEAAGGRCDEGAAQATEGPGQILGAMERIMLQLPGRHVIFRCGQLCGPHRPLQAIAASSPLSAANLTPYPLVQEAVALALDHPLEGTWNLVHPEHPTRFELARRLLRAPVEPEEQVPGSAAALLGAPSANSGIAARRGSKWVVGEAWERVRQQMGLHPWTALSAQPIWPPDGRPEAL